jgi:hypothetical protein
LNSTHDYGIIFGGLNVIDQLEGSCDMDYVALTLSQIGYVFSCQNNTTPWSSQNRKSTTISTMEIKYLVTCVATKEVIWLYHLSFNMGVPQHHPKVIYGDNQNVIKLMKKIQIHKKTKHIDINTILFMRKYENTKISIDYISNC